MKKRKSILAAAVLLAGLAVSVLLGGCGGGAANGEVYIYSYGDYFDEALLDSFESETGIKPIVTYYDTAEEMYPVINNGSGEYDVICTSDYMIQKMAEEGLLTELNKDNIPNLENIDPIYMEKSEAFDPGNKYSVPHAVGISGIIYDKDLIKEKVGNEKIDSWADLWNSKLSESIVMPDSVREDFMIALRKNGFDQNTVNEEELKTAAADLKAQKPLVYKYANDSARDLLIDGSAAIGVVWNGEYIYTKEGNDNVGFVVPSEGTEFFIDSWCIPANVKNKDNAEAFINYFCSAEAAKANFDYLHYTTPNKAAYELIDEEYTKDPAVFPTKETLEKCDSLKTLDDDAMGLYSKYWKEVKAS